MAQIQTPYPKNSDMVTANRTISRMTIARAQERHWRKLAHIAQRNIRPNNVNNRWQTNHHKSRPMYGHLYCNLKRDQIQDERFVEIERENRILLDKMSQLMVPTQHADPTEGTWEFSPGVRLNRFQVPVTDHGISHSPARPQFGQAQIKDSLNGGFRRRELERITSENRGIVSRIQSQVTAYPNEEWSEHSRRHDRYMSLCSRPTVGSGVGFGLPNYILPPVRRIAPRAARTALTHTAPPRAL
eukprot:1382415-Prymnesium_polylepis.1